MASTCGRNAMRRAATRLGIDVDETTRLIAMGLRARASRGTSREHLAVTGGDSIASLAATARSWCRRRIRRSVMVAKRDRFRSARAPCSADVSAMRCCSEFLARLVPAHDDVDDAVDRSLCQTPRSATSDADRGTVPRISGDGHTLLRVCGRAYAASPRTEIVLHDRVAAPYVPTATAEGDPDAWSRAEHQRRLRVAASSARYDLRTGWINGELEETTSSRSAGWHAKPRERHVSGVQPGHGNSILPSRARTDGGWDSA